MSLLIPSAYGAKDEVLYECQSRDTEDLIQISRGGIIINGEISTGNSGSVPEEVTVEASVEEVNDPNKINGRDRSTVDNLKDAFKDSIIRIKVQTPDELLIDQMDFLKGKITSSDEKFEVKYSDGGFFKSHKMKLVINNQTGDGVYEEKRKTVFSSKVEKQYRFTDCQQVF